MADGPIGSSMFSGVAALTPYYHLWTEKLYNNKRLLQFLDAVHPYYKAPSEFKARDPEWKALYGHLDEDKTFVGTFRARTGMIWIEEQERALESLLNTDVPFLFIETEKDDVV